MASEQLTGAMEQAQTLADAIVDRIWSGENSDWIGARSKSMIRADVINALIEAAGAAALEETREPIWDCRVCGFGVREGAALAWIRDHGEHYNAVSERVANKGTAYCPTCSDETLRCPSPSAGRAQAKQISLDYLSALYRREAGAAALEETHDCEAWAMEGIGCANCNPIARELRERLPDVHQRIDQLAALEEVRDPELRAIANSVDYIALKEKTEDEQAYMVLLHTLRQRLQLKIWAGTAEVFTPEQLTALEWAISELSAVSRCDCGAKLTHCHDCAVADYQAAHPDCTTCCVRSSSPSPRRPALQPLPDHDNHHNALACPYCVPNLAELFDGKVGELQGTIARLAELLREIERHCPCGARPETPNTHHHVGGCPVEAAIELADRHAGSTRP